MRCLAPLLLWLCFPAGNTGRAAAQTRPIILESVEISQQGGAVVVDITADGPLPIPATGRVESPPRYFLDFPGVIARTRGVPSGSGALKRVRVALNTANPPMTRVVLDLTHQPPVQIQGDHRERGRIRLILGSAEPAAQPDPAAAAPAPPAAEVRRQPLIPIPSAPGGPPSGTGPPAGADIPPVPSLPPPSGTAGATLPAGPGEPPRDLPRPAVYPVDSGTPETTPPTADEKDGYRKNAGGPLARLRTLRPLLTAIDQREARPPEGLADARSEVSAAIRTLAGIHAPASLKPTHDLLLRAASLSLMAVTLRADAGTRADPTDIRNASSAAAGALLLLDRVCIELGCPDQPRP